MANPQQLRVFGLVFLIVSLGLLGVAGFFTLNTLRFLDRSVSVQGTITALVPVTRSGSDQDGGGSQITYAPEFSFTAADGRVFSVTSTFSSNPASFDVGDTVSVLYQPDHPDHARIDSFGQLWGISLIVGGIGAVFLAVALAVILQLRAVIRRSAASLSTP
jgi:hypothetical protein